MAVIISVRKYEVLLLKGSINKSHHFFIDEFFTFSHTIFFHD